MKKLLATLCVFLLVCSACTVTYAEESTITFRGIPWHSSPDNAIKMLEEQFDADNMTVEYSINTDNLQQWHPKSTKRQNTYHIPILVYTIEAPSLKIAGYELYDSIMLEFIPVLSEDGQTYELSEEAGSLWAAYYYLKLPDIMTMSEMKEDLTSKLDSIYGQYSYRYTNEITVSGFKNGKAYARHEKNVVWAQHPNPDQRSLVYHVPNAYIELSCDHDDYVTLSYKCNINEIEETVSAIEEIIESEKEAEKNSEFENSVGHGTDGL